MVELFDILFDYLEIYNRFPTDTFLSKAQRKTRHSELMKWTKQEYQIMPDIDEIIVFMRENDTLKYEQPFFLKVVTPCVLNDMENGKIASLRFLFECNGMDNHRINTATDYVQMFCLGTKYKYDAWDLADRVLEYEPDNQVVLHYKYTAIRGVLAYSIHEVPSGVLSGIDGAEKEYMPNMQKLLREFAALSKKLNKDDERFIQKCADIFNAWEYYLTHTEDYGSFEDYLIKHKITYR